MLSVPRDGEFDVLESDLRRLIGDALELRDLFRK